MLQQRTICLIRALAIGAMLGSWTVSGLAQTTPLKTITLTVKPTVLANCPVVVHVTDIEKQFPDFNPTSFVVRTGDLTALHTLPSQADDLNGDGKPDEIAFEADWAGPQSQIVELVYGPEAEIAPLRATAPSAAHAIFSKKLEGLCWENDRVAWRLYDDKRNAIDIYAKNSPLLSLDYLGKPGVNYEKDSPYGRDIFWDGKAMGIGSVAAWADGKLVRVSDVTARNYKILADGPVRAVAEMTYTGWQVGGKSVTLTDRFTIWAHQHWFLQDLTASNADDLTFVTGLPIKSGVTTLTSASPLHGGQHRFLATWGKQVQRSGEESDRVNGDNLGLAVILSHGPISDPTQKYDDPLNNVIAISMHHHAGISTGRYAVLAGWDKESQDPQPVTSEPGAEKIPDAVSSADSWRKYIEQLNPPVFTTASVKIVPPITSTASAASAAVPVMPAAASDPPTLTRQSILSIMRRTCDYQLALQATHKENNGWVRSTFYAGVMALYSATHDKNYLDQAVAWANAMKWTPSGRDRTFADNQCCVQTYAELAMLQKDPSKLDPTLAIYKQQMATDRPGRSQWWWCDSLFMAPAGMVRVSAATGDPQYSHYMEKLWWDTTDFLYDKDEHLFFRDKTFFHKKAQNGKPVFWSRGNGWVMGGTVRVLDYLPKSDPDYKRFVKLHQEMAAKIVTLQGADGLWRTSLLDPNQFPSPETSGSGFFTYALAWGINHHTLDRAQYLPAVKKGWLGLANLVTPDGRLNYAQAVGGAPAKVRPGNTAEYAVGAFLLAGAQMLQIVDGQ